MSDRQFFYILFIVSVGLILVLAVFVFGSWESSDDNNATMSSIDNSPEITHIEASYVPGEDVAEVTWRAVPHEDDLLTWALVYTDANGPDYFMDSELHRVSCDEACDEEQTFTSRIEVDYDGGETLFVQAYFETQEGEVLTESPSVILE